MNTQWFRVRGMSSRQSVRAVSARISDVPGVRTVEAQLDSGTVRVTGTADATAVQDAIRLAGYDVVAMPDGPSVNGTADAHPARDVES